MLRFQRLSEFPPGFFIDEGAHGLDALQILQGKHAVFFPGNHGREGLIVYLISLFISILGRTILAVRLPTALASASTVFVTFWLGHILFGEDEDGRANPWRGLVIGGVGASLLAVSIGQTILGRIAFRANFLPLILSLCLALLWWGWRQQSRSGSWWRIALSGACVGLLPYTYIAARFTPILFLFFGLSFLLPFGYLGKQRLRAELPQLGIFVGMAALVAMPILVYFSLHPEHFFLRSSQLLVFAPSISQGNTLATFLYNVWEHLLVFGFRGDPNWRHNFAGRSLLNPWEALFFWLGVAMAVWRWQRPAYRLLLLWLGVLLLPAILARDDTPPNTLRMIGAMPAIYLLAAVGAWETFRFLRNRFFQNNETRAAIAVGVVVSGSILVQGVLTHHTYFELWAHAPETRRVHGVEWKDLARVLNAQPSEVSMVYLLSQAGSSEHYGFTYLYHGAPPAHIIDSTLPYLPLEINSTLAAMENLSTVRVVDWNSDAPSLGEGDGNIIALLERHGRYLGSDEFAYFRIHTYTDLALDRPWTFYEALEPLAVRYDGGIDLQGLALGQGGAQLSSQQLFRLERGRPIWVGLQWQSTPGLGTDFSISLRLHSSDGAVTFQKDAVLGNPSHARTSHWSAEQVVDTLFHLDFPDDLPTGEYELRLVVYDTATLTPTVEIGVWEPELVLARMRLAGTQ